MAKAHDKEKKQGRERGRNGTAREVRDTAQRRTLIDGICSMFVRSRMSHPLQKYAKISYRIPADRCSRTHPGGPTEAQSQGSLAGQTQGWAETTPANLEPAFIPNVAISSHLGHRIAAEALVRNGPVSIPIVP